MRHTSSGGFPYRLATTRLGVVVEEGQRFESRECGETYHDPSHRQTNRHRRHDVGQQPTVTTTTFPHSAGGVSHGLGSKDANADVTVGKVVVDATLGIPSAPVTVTNHSSKRSNYIIEISLETATTQVDSTLVAVNNLEPGQTSTQSAQFLGAIDKSPAGAKAVIKSVDRLAS